MKKIAFLFLLSGFLFACEKDTELETPTQQVSEAASDDAAEAEQADAEVDSEVECPCDVNSKVPLQGTWQLIALKIERCVQTDPEPIFNPTPSNKTITFLANGTVNSTGELCEFGGQQTSSGSSAPYSVANASIEAVNCNHPYNSNDVGLPFEQLGNCLIIRYRGFPGVEAKYQRQ